MRGMTYNRDELVRHPNRPEWGVGRVHSVSADNTVFIHFSKVGLKKLQIDRVTFSLTKLDASQKSVVQYH